MASLYFSDDCPLPLPSPRSLEVRIVAGMSIEALAVRGSREIRSGLR